jgi:hypothetical protein
MTATLRRAPAAGRARVRLRTLLLGLLCVSLAIPSVGDTAPTPESILAAATFRLNQLSGGQALALARELLCSSNVVDLVLRALDQNADAALSFDEVLQAKPLMLAGELSKLFSPSKEPGPPIGDDKDVISELEEVSRRLADYLQLGVGNETLLPNLPLDTLRGDPRGFLEAASQFPKTQVRGVVDLIADLDTRMFPKGDMTQQNMHVNMQRKGILMGRADGLLRHLGGRSLPAVQNQLLWLRAHMDGAPQPPDWA